MTTSTSSNRRSAAAAASSAAARQEATRRRWVRRVGAVVIAALLVLIAAAVALGSRGEETTVASAALVVPAHATADGAIPVGEPDAPVTVAVYVDYLCPFCGRFEQANGNELERLVRDGTTRVELRPLSFLDAQSDGSAYSTRTANAVATVADGAPDRVWDFHQAVFEQQPQEGTAGPTDEELAQIARDAGVPEAVVGRFADRTFAPWVADVTRKAFASAITGTPTVVVNGAVFSGDLYSTGPLTQAVESAAAAP